jgi:hypothetical protein
MPPALPLAKYLNLRANNLEVDFIDPEAKATIVQSAQRILNKVERDITNPPDGPLSYRDLVWPQITTANMKTTTPQLRVVPLERIGVMQGKSGSKVMLAYFVSSNDPDNTDFWSTPMVLKIAKTCGSADNKLRIEKANADIVKGFVGERHRFALPFDFWDGANGQVHSVLWSRFTRNTKLWSNSGDKYWLGLDDLRSLLKGECTVEGAKTEDVVTQAFELLRPLHNKGLTKPNYQKTNIVRHYQWYLRDILNKRLEWPTSNPHWTVPWKAVWGPHTRKDIKQFGASWKNPFWVLDRLRSFPDQNLLCGVVHGDFHPRNIVITDRAEPYIIDFGWSGDYRHISQDFVLLECNLRFLIQQPAVPFADLRSMSDWIGFDDNKTPSLATDIARKRAKLITNLRKAARAHFPPSTNWDVEYIVPLFLTALGLLKHMTDCENQLASQLTILSLAQYISTNVLSRTR